MARTRGGGEGLKIQPSLPAIPQKQVVRSKRKLVVPPFREKAWGSKNGDGASLWPEGTRRLAVKDHLIVAASRIEFRRSSTGASASTRVTGDAVRLKRVRHSLRGKGLQFAATVPPFGLLKEVPGQTVNVNVRNACFQCRETDKRLWTRPKPNASLN